MKSATGAGAGAGIHDMKEETVNEIEPEAPPTLSKEKRTAMNKLLKATTQLCSVYNVEFRNLAENTCMAWRSI